MQCNRNCFTCIFEDCIVDELMPEDLEEINQRDREIRFTNKDNKRKKIAEQQRKYRAAHKEEIAERKRKYYAMHKEEILERKRKNYQIKKNKKPASVGAQDGQKVYNIKST